MDRAFGKITNRSEVSIDAKVQTEDDELKGMTRAEIRVYANEKYGLNPGELFRIPDRLINE